MTTIIELTNGERAVLVRALRVYSSHYQGLIGAERNPVQKANLRTYVGAADRMMAKLEPFIQHGPVPDPVCNCAHASIDEPGAEFCPVHGDK